MSDDIIYQMDLILKKADYYEIQPGDTFDKIVSTNPVAIQNKVTVPELMQANKNIQPTNLQINQKIIIPSGQLLQQIRKQREAPKLDKTKQLKHQIDGAFKSAAAATGVDESILRGIAWVESKGDICAGSDAGAQGLMQLMPATAKLFGVSDSLDPVASIYGGARYYATLLEKARSLAKYRPQTDVNRLALMMYNIGETKFLDALRTGKALPSETTNYPDKVYAARGYRPDAYFCSTLDV